MIKVKYLRKLIDEINSLLIPLDMDYSEAMNSHRLVFDHSLKSDICTIKKIFFGGCDRLFTGTREEAKSYLLAYLYNVA